MPKPSRINAELDARRREGGERLTPAAGLEPPNSVNAMIRAYCASRSYAALRASTQKGDRNRLGIPAQWASDKAADRITLKAANRDDGALTAARGVHMANGVIRVAHLMFGHGARDGGVRENPFRGEVLRLTGAPPRVMIWSQAEIEALVETLDAAGDYGVADAVGCAYCTGQRQGDVLAAQGGFIEGERWRLRQSETGAVVALKPMAWVQRRWAATRARKAAAGVAIAHIHVDDRTAAAFIANTLGRRFRAARATLAKDRPDVANKTFQDLRDTAVTALVRSGARKDEVAAVTGHNLHTIDPIMRHYLLIDATPADVAIAKRIAAERNE